MTAASERIQRASSGGGTGAVAALLLAAAGSATAWAAFLSWGFDGAYPTWQVIASGLAWVIVAFGCRVLARGRAAWATAAGLVIGYVAAWSWWASQDDPTGMWLVGAILLVVGLTVAATLVVLVADAILRRRR